MKNCHALQVIFTQKTCVLIPDRISPYLFHLFHYAKDVTTRQGRNPHHSYVPSVRTNYGKSSLRFEGTFYGTVYTCYYRACKRGVVLCKRPNF